MDSQTMCSHEDIPIDGVLGGDIITKLVFITLNVEQWSQAPSNTRRCRCYFAFLDHGRQDKTHEHDFAASINMLRLNATQ